MREMGRRQKKHTKPVETPRQNVEQVSLVVDDPLLPLAYRRAGRGAGADSLTSRRAQFDPGTKVP
jgi:hypothetical protein